ncbi:MAG: hypothetical protein GX418_00650 [Clostridiales bacterium]|nr:hypothetical protein [Clostridiales bacterium]
MRQHQTRKPLILIALTILGLLVFAGSAAASSLGGWELFSDPGMTSVEAERAQTLVDSAAFAAGATVSGETVRFAVGQTVAKTDLLMLHFTAYAEDRCGMIEITVGQDAYQAAYALPTAKTDYFLPVTGVTEVGDVTVTLTTDLQPAHIGNFELVNVRVTPVTTLKTGLYNLDAGSETVLTEDMAVAAKATALLADETHLYALQGGVLTVFSLEDQAAPKKVGFLSGLGNTRDADFCAKGKALVITSRENGLYVVDIRDPEKPKLLSNFPTLEMATGLAVSGDYAFVCSRYYGVEIIDIRTQSEPVRRSVISNNEEFYDCCVSGNYLYAASWAERKVEVYDVSDVTRPVAVSTIPLGGQGGGVCVQDGLLYVATGYNGRNTVSGVASPGYGTGNGMEIYDVSDPAAPVWLSTSNIDGRYKNSGNDHWKVRVAGHYAYYSVTTPGVYVYDVSDPAAPVRVDKITIRIPSTSEKYRLATQGPNLLPYDTAAFMQGPVMGLAFAEGSLYLSDVTSGIYVYQKDWIVPETAPDTAKLTQSKPAKAELPAVEGYTVTAYQGVESVYAVAAADNGRLFAACGADGIHVLDAKLKLVKRVATQGPALDAVISGDLLYVAESAAGLGVYRISRGNASEIGRWTMAANTLTVSDIALSPDGTRILAQAGWTRLTVLDVTDPASPVLDTAYGEKPLSVGTMYYRNLCSGTVDGLVGAQDSQKQRWFDFTQPAESAIVELPNPFASQPNGYAAFGEQTLAVYRNGYVLFDPRAATEEELKNLTVHMLPGKTKLKGKPAVEGELLVASFGYGKQVTLASLADPENPALIAQFTVPGYPDTASFLEGSILIPLRVGGLLRLTPN